MNHPSRTWVLVLHIILFLLIFCTVAKCQKGEYRGCFADNENLRDLPYRALETDSHLSVDKCIEACFQKYYMFLGLQGGKSCFCGSTYGKYGINNCTIRCEANSTQFCGGINANSVYLTGFAKSGPPQNVTLTLAREHSLVIRWLPPQAPNGVITQYKVTASVSKLSDGVAVTNPHLQWSFSNTTFESELPGMVPGTLYNVTVQANSGMGEGVPFNASFWTDIAEPDRPPTAQILKSEGSTMVIEIPDVQSNKGPIAAYQVIVHDESSRFPFDPNRLTNYNDAKAKDLPFYLAAELLPQQARTNFIVGDGGQYNGYFNARLGSDKEYAIIIGVVVRQHGISKAAYSDPVVYRMTMGVEESAATKAPEVLIERPVVRGNDVGSESEIYDNHGMHDNPESKSLIDSSLVTGLSVAVGIGATLLIASIIIYFLIRRHYGQRQQSDHQELTVQSTSELSENGVVSSILVMDDERDLEFLYDSLKDRFWHIPKQNLEITQEILGYGKYGPIHKGVANRRNSQIPVAVQFVRAHAGESDRQRRNFVNDLDTLIRIGSHTNVVSLIGGCENDALLYTCTEWYSGTLKSFLLDSRTMDNYPVFAERQHRTSTLKELQLLEIALGIARGMAHLVHNKVIHQRLSSRSVVIVDEVIAKVTDFGVTQMDFNPPFDITRWLSLETLKNRMFTTKSDVWMFGVVLWEIVTLGATPYSTIKTRDVAGRVIRGSRLHQPKNTGDDLYQIMLQCWQIDQDERPSFQELTTIFGKMVTESNDTDHLNLNLHSGFQYEKYEMESEICQQMQ